MHSTHGEDMKILVIDDSFVHQESARQTLTGHELTVATSYEEGFRLLAPFDSQEHYIAKGKKGGVYDVVLSDLLMPAPGMMLSDEARREYEGKEHALGWALVLRAVLNGARYAAVVSQVNHHAHPAAFALDAIDNADDDDAMKPQFDINGARVGFFHAPTCLVEGVYGCYWKCDRGKNERGNPCKLCNGTGFARGKDWGLVLRVLLGN
jgi:CheY-like chemotaxis protein